MNIDEDNTLIIELATGNVVIELLPEVAPLHVERLLTLARAGEYDNVAFHRVIDGFVAQTGDVQFGDLEDGYNPALVGRGGSDLPDLPAEFSDIPYDRGVVGMARSTDPDSANSQFFIMFDEGYFLNNNYTVVGRVIEGMRFVDQIKRGEGQSGAVTDPDRMVDVEVAADIEEGFGLGLSVEEAREITLLYEAGLDRDGDIDLAGLNFWIDAREAGASYAAISSSFLASAEFTEAFGDVDTLSDEDLVRQLYRNVLEREGEDAGVAFWTNALAGDAFSREDVLVAFARSAENVAGSAYVETIEEYAPGHWDFA